jgi:hypothetical protein
MQIIGVYPGRYQPPHKGHLAAFNYLKKVIGPNNTFVATSDKVELPKSPLNFQDKQDIWAKHGVTNNVIKTKNPYTPIEILQKFNKDNTAVVFGVGEKDMEGDPRFSFKTKKDGSPSYFQLYRGNENNLRPYGEHGYILVIPTEVCRVDGKQVSGTNVRDALGGSRYTDEQKKSFFKWVFGWFDDALFTQLKDKLSQGVASSTNVPMKVVNELRNYIEYILKEELTSTDASISKLDTDPKSDYEARKTAQKEREVTLRTLAAKKKDLAFKKEDAKRIQKDEIPKLIDQEKVLRNTVAGITT